MNLLINPKNAVVKQLRPQSTVYAAAIRLGFQSHFFVRTLEVVDDHSPSF
jgi:hypothetical protein